MFKSSHNRIKSRIKDYISPGDLKLLNNADVVPWKYRIMYNTLFYSALRIGELTSLKPSNLIKLNDEGQDHYFINLETQKNQETDEYTPIRLQDYTAIKDFIESNNIHTNDYIFGSKKFNKSKPITTSWFNIQLKQHCKLVGITKDISSHSFRAGRVTQLRKDDVSYAEIASITRHKNINVLMTHYNKRLKFDASNIVNRH